MADLAYLPPQRVRQILAVAMRQGRLLFINPSMVDVIHEAGCIYYEHRELFLCDCHPDIQVIYLPKRGQHV